MMEGVPDCHEAAALDTTRLGSTCVLPWTNMMFHDLSMIPPKCGHFMTPQGLNSTTIHPDPTKIVTVAVHQEAL